MKELISDQTVDFDTHQAGDGREVTIDGLHMHKRMNGKRFRGVSILFPLDDKEDIIIRPKRAQRTNAQQQIINEIQRVLKRNPEKRNELVDTVIAEIERYAEDSVTQNNIATIRRGAVRIAKIFTKDGRIRDELMQKIDNKLQYLITTHAIEEKGHSKQFYIKQDLIRNRIKISDDIEALNYGNTPKRFEE